MSMLSMGDIYERDPKRPKLETAPPPPHLTEPSAPFFPHQPHPHPHHPPPPMLPSMTMTHAPSLPPQPSQQQQQQYGNDDAPTMHHCNHPGCGKKYSKIGKLNRHKLSHGTLRPHTCTVIGCTRAFVRSDHLKAHEKTHQAKMSTPDSRPYKCTFDGCDKTFNTSTHLKRHHTTHGGTEIVNAHAAIANRVLPVLIVAGPDGVTTYSCNVPQCSAVYTPYASQAELTNHQASAHPPPPLPAGKVDTKPKRRKNADHVPEPPSHLPPPPPPMTFIPPPPAAQPQHQHHQHVPILPIISHLPPPSIYASAEHGNQAFPKLVPAGPHIEQLLHCSFAPCNQSFRLHSELSHHVRTHHTPMKYVCPKCPLTFDSSLALIAHDNDQHDEDEEDTGERHACTVQGCNKSYSKAGNLRTHIKAEHEGVVFTCDLCYKIFTAKQNLESHIRDQHENPQEHRARRVNAKQRAFGQDDMGEQ